MLRPHFHVSLSLPLTTILSLAKSACPPGNTASCNYITGSMYGMLLNLASSGVEINGGVFINVRQRRCRPNTRPLPRAGKPLTIAREPFR